MQTLWDFSLAIYGLPEVAPACIACQEEAGADVNVLLFLLWQAKAGHLLSERDVAAADGQVTTWRERVVIPLRAIRRELKSGMHDAPGGFRERIKALELEAERIEQDTLSHVALPDAVSDAIEAARANLRAYAAVIGRPLPNPPLQDILNAFSSLIMQGGINGRASS